MKKNSLTFECYFDVLGRQSSHTHHCFFDVVTDTDSQLILHTHEDIQNPSDIDLIRYRIKPVIGFLKDKEKTYVNAKLVFIKTNEITSSFGNVVSEVCYTDEGGMYRAYIEPGTYDVEIYINNQKIIKRNQVIAEGLRHTYSIEVKGLIYKKQKDITTFCGTEYKNIYGQLIDNKNTPLENAEIIIIQNNEIQAYVKTDDDGKYSFALKNGKYLLKMRCKKSPIKTMEIEIGDVYGFSEQFNNSIIFSKKQMLRM